MLPGAVALLLAPEAATAWDPPTAAPFRSAFEARYASVEANGAALELEKLGARLGLDLVPNRRMVEPPENPGEDWMPEYEKVAGDRAVPTREAAAAFREVARAAGQFLERELKLETEPIGAAPPRLLRFLSEHDAVLDSVESLLLGGDSVVWDMDVRIPLGPFPNGLGVIQLQRLLVGRALVKARGGDVAGALRTIEAGWRLSESLAERPDLAAHVLVVAVAKLHVGALRKFDTPAWGWSDRLRSGDLFHAFLAAFQNEFWIFSEATDLTGVAGARGRVLRQVAEEFRDTDLCHWDQRLLEEAWERAVRDHVETEEELVLSEIMGPNLMQMLARWRRFAIDAELTALVLDARAQRAASRRRSWPVKLHTLGTGACPRGGWTYRAAGTTATVAFEGRIEETGGPAFRLPFRFTAGTASPPRRQAPVAKTLKS